jgi:hypothetical protein
MTDIRPFPPLLRVIACAAVLCLASVASSPAQIAVRSALVDDRDATPGATYEGSVTIENLTDQPQQARVSLRDYHFDHTGSNAFDDPGTLDRSNAAWIEVQPAIVTIPPNQMEEVQYTVQVPSQTDDGAPVGTYWSVVMIEPIAPGSAESTLEGESSEQHRFGVRQVTRFGVQVATHIRGTGSPNVEVLSANLQRQGETPRLIVNLRNTGSTLARPSVQLEVYDASGEVALRTEAEPNRLYPGTSVRHTLDLSELGSGTYEALVLVDAGGDQVSGKQYTLEL